MFIKVDGLCLFCNQNYDRKLRSGMGFKPLLIPKHVRCFEFLCNQLGIAGAPTSDGFNFISESMPLCLSCYLIFDQLHSFQLKLKAIQMQIQMQVQQIHNLILKSEEAVTDPLALNSSSNHFNLFRRQVVESKDSSADFLNYRSPYVKLNILTQEEIESISSNRAVQHEFQYTFFENNGIMEAEVEVSQQPFDSDIHPDEYYNEAEDIEIEEKYFPFECQNEIEKNIEDAVVVKSFSIVPPEVETGGNGTPEVETGGNETPEVETGGNETLVVETGGNKTLEVETGDNATLEVETGEPVSTSAVTSSMTTISIVNLELKRPPVRPKRTFEKCEGDDDCKLCEKKNKSEQELIRHYKSEHPGQRPFKCTDCNLTGWQRKSIRKHVLRRHSPEEEREKERRYECTVCDKKYICIKSLRYHLKVHAGEKSFVCIHCNKAFRQQNALKVHIQRIHEDDEVTRKFQCPHCPKKFKEKETYQHHVAIHTGEKTYSCHICGIKTIQRQPMRKHFKVHQKKNEWVEPPKNSKYRWKTT